MKKTWIVMVLALILIFVSGCGRQADQRQTTGTTTQAPTTTTESETEPELQADPFGRYGDTVVIRIGMSVDPTQTLPDGDTPENNQYTRHVRDQLNIDTQVFWQAANGPDYNQRVNLAIASNDLPDAMVVNATQLRQMVRAGQLADLKEVYDKYASPVMKDMFDRTEGRALGTATFDGELLALPNLNVPEDGYHLMWIRKDWLDKLNLNVPKTIEDLESVAEAFVKNDPNGTNAADTIGIVGPQSGGRLYADFLASSNNVFGFDPIFSAFDAFPGYWLKGSDGRPVYGSILPETREALLKLREMYANGLIDREMGIRRDSAELIAAGTAGIFFGPWWMGYWPLPDAIENNPEANWQAYAAPLDADGIWNPHMSTTSNVFIVVRENYEHPEAVIKMNNLLIRDESKFDLSKGGIGNYPLRAPMAPYDESPFTIQALWDVLEGERTPEDFADPKYDVYKLLRDDVANIRQVKIEPYDNMDIQYWDTKAAGGAWNRLYSLMVGVSAIYDHNYPTNHVYSLIYAHTQTTETRWANLKKMEDEVFFRIIMGAAPIEEFDRFVEDWKAQGGDVITEEVAQAMH